MRLPPTFIQELLSRVVISDVVGRRVTWDRRKSNPRKRDYWACCPFHGEKTPSFHVEDDKGRYYCFGCHAKGNAIDFLMAQENMPFMEAVESLARDVGMRLPEATPEERQAQERKQKSLDLTEEAARFFEAQLWSSAGQAARDYLKRRGADEAAIHAYRLGYAPAGDALLRKLRELGGKDAALVEAGLAREGRDGRGIYAYFRDRLIFPINDGLGRVIGFGARALADGVEPKYLNSPDTPSFHKGQVLYNADRAKRAAREASRLLVVEGYMDVIALGRAGLDEAVAPLGTALTEDQLSALWRIDGAPILCLDGDKAGVSAAYRALDRALPMLQAERTLRFVFLPDGQDPDDLLARSGLPVFEALVKKTLGPADVIWQRELEEADETSPEGRAALERRLMSACGQIGDPTLAYHIKQDLRARLRRLTRSASNSTFSARSNAQISAGRSLLKSALALQARASVTDPSPVVGHARERLLMAGVLNHPWLLESHAEAFARVEFHDADMDSLRALVLDVGERHGESLDGQTLQAALAEAGAGDKVRRVFASASVRLERPLRAGAERSEAEACWRGILSLHLKASSLLRELAEAEARYRRDQTKENEAHLLSIRRQIHALDTTGHAA